MAAIVSTIQALTNALCPARALTIVPATMTGFPGDGSSAYMLPLLQQHLAYMTQVTAPFSRDLPNAHTGHKAPIHIIILSLLTNMTPATALILQKFAYLKAFRYQVIYP